MNTDGFQRMFRTKFQNNDLGGSGLGGESEHVLRDVIT